MATPANQLRRVMLPAGLQETVHVHANTLASWLGRQMNEGTTATDAEGNVRTLDATSRLVMPAAVASVRMAVIEAGDGSQAITIRQVLDGHHALTGSAEIELRFVERGDGTEMTATLGTVTNGVVAESAIATVGSACDLAAHTLDIALL